MRALQDHLKSQGDPRIVSWGIHEGIRGATWIELHADGTVNERRYVPNPDATTESAKLGIVPPERFQNLIGQLAEIHFEQFGAPPCPAPSTNCYSLECVWAESRWEFVIASHRVRHDSPLGQLAEVFHRLVQEAGDNGDRRPSQKMQQ